MGYKPVRRRKYRKNNVGRFFNGLFSMVRNAFLTVFVCVMLLLLAIGSEVKISFNPSKVKDKSTMIEAISKGFQIAKQVKEVMP